MARTTLHSRRVWTRKELRAGGKSREAIAWALEDGRIYEIHRGVYAVGHPRLTHDEAWLAAVLACGKDALLTARSGAELREWLKPRGGRPHVLIPASRQVERPGIEIHRSAHVGEDDRTTVRGIPVTSVSRTLIDLAATEDQRTLRRALRQAEYLRHVDLARLRRSLDDAVRLKGSTRLRKTLDFYVKAGCITESDPEDDLLALCRKHRIETPRAQYALGPYRWDFAWPQQKVLLDIDEYDGHHQLIALVEDRAKDRHAVAHRFIPLRVIDAELAAEPKKVASDLADALASSPA